MKYFKYIWYITKHKWFVMLACFSEGLVIQGLFHDLSKLLPSEFFPYVNHFCRKNRNISQGRDSSGYYKVSDSGDPAFIKAWWCHFKRNKHHWQYWVTPDRTKNHSHGLGLGVEGFIDECIPLEIPEKYIIEMVCDWYGAGKAQGNLSKLEERYNKVQDKMVLHPETAVRFRYHLNRRDNR